MPQGEEDAAFSQAQMESKCFRPRLEDNPELTPRPVDRCVRPSPSDRQTRVSRAEASLSRTTVHPGQHLASNYAWSLLLQRTEEDAHLQVGFPPLFHRVRLNQGPCEEVLLLPSAWTEKPSGRMVPSE